MFDERFFRMFNFYLKSCEMSFLHGDQVVYQLQLTKKLNTAPSTRDYIYSWVAAISKLADEKEKKIKKTFEEKIKKKIL